MSNKFEIGIIGLAVMGMNLARNFASKQIPTIVFNRTTETTEKFIKEFGNKNLQGSKNLKDFIDQLEKPRKIILMVKAGEAVDMVISQLKPLLEKNDIIVDAGNSYYHDTNRRQNELKKELIQLIGMGLSGGEEGALHGPSLMPGGEKIAYQKIAKLLEKISAKDYQKNPCVTYIGAQSTGHFVKMVHNGIEYGMMQLIAETYQILKKIGKLKNSEIANTFKNYNKKFNLNSFLTEISGKILAKKEGSKYLIDLIRDEAGQKGTGRWTTEAAMEYGIPIPTINAAVDARILSSSKNLRKNRKDLKIHTLKSSKIQKSELIKICQSSLELSTILTYIQGFEILRTASETNNWNLDLNEIARIWQGGCIIRSKLLTLLQNSYGDQNHIAKTARKKIIANFNSKNQKNWRKTLALSIENGLPTPSLTASLSYFDGIASKNLPQNLIQAQRDFFGAHGYERIDKNGNFHTNWESL